MRNFIEKYYTVIVIGVTILISLSVAFTANVLANKNCEICTIPDGWQSASGDFLTYKFDAESIVHKITWSTEYVLLTDSCGKQWIKRKISEK